MHNIEFMTMNNAYYALYRRVQLYGYKFVHRGHSCMEVRPCSFTLHEPQNGLFTGAPRRMNYRFWAAETLGYIAGWGTTEKERYALLLCKLNSNYENFKHTPTGVEELFPMVRYGDGFGQGLARVYETLKDKVDSRQAYVSIWDRDTPHSYVDSPCLIGAQFFTVQNMHGERLLSSLFNIRSNDLNWGLPYDVAAFCAIQSVVAGTLGLRMGPYNHVAASLHYYEKMEYAPTGCCPPNVNDPDHEEWIKDPPRIPSPPVGYSMEQVQKFADLILNVMFTHFVELKQPAKSFCMDHARLVPWITEWQAVIKWGWPK